MASSAGNTNNLNRKSLWRLHSQSPFLPADGTETRHLSRETNIPTRGFSSSRDVILVFLSQILIVIWRFDARLTIVTDEAQHRKRVIVILIAICCHRRTIRHLPSRVPWPERFVRLRCRDCVLRPGNAPWRASLCRTQKRRESPEPYAALGFARARA